MKSIIKYTYGMLLMGAVASCSPEEFDTVSQDLIPTVSDKQIQIAVQEEDPTINTAVFSTNINAGEIAVWYLDGEPYSRLNPATFSNLLAGEHTVELKILNRNGLSLGSVSSSFSFSTTKYDYAALFKKIVDKEWRVNYVVQGHLGCGTSGSDGSDWWSADPNNKAEWGVYDDRITFSHGDGDSATGGKFTYNPGEGGTVYVNHGVTDSKFAEYTAVGHAKNPQEDVMVSVEAQESSFSIELDENGNAVIVLAEKTLMPYIPNDETYLKPVYRIEKVTNEDLALVTDNGGIAWRMVLTSTEDTGMPTEPTIPAVDLNPEAITKLLASSPTGWRIDGAVKGHMGCGPSGSAGLDWWSADPNNKEEYGVYETVLTFSADGKYSIVPSSKGVYVNHGVTNALFAEQTAEGHKTETDVNVVVDAQTSTFEISGSDDACVLKLAANTLFPYIPFDASYENPTFKVASANVQQIVLIADNGDIAWTFTLTNAFEIKSADDVKTVLSAAKGWHIDGSVKGHMGCGPSGSTGLDWWSADPDNKKDFGVYESVVTFSADGKYVYTPSSLGVYVNHGVTAPLFAEETAKGHVTETDVNVAVEEQESTFEVTGADGEYVLTLAANTLFPYIPNDANYEKPSFKMTTIEPGKIVLVCDEGNIAWTFTLAPIE